MRDSLKFISSWGVHCTNSPGNIGTLLEYFVAVTFKEREVSVTADNIEFRNIKEVAIQSSQDKNCKILFDNNHSIEDKILNEQFEY